MCGIMCHGMIEYVIGYGAALLASFLAVTVVLTLHEFSHAFVAYRCGDPTPKFYGRLTLNPLKHFDIVGLLCFTLVGFGWAKPVPIDPRNFRKYRQGLFLTASAGILMNLLTAFIFYPLYMVVGHYLPQIPYLYDFLTEFCYLLFAYSLSFAVFNLLPLYPLDGFRIVDALDRRRGPVFRFLRNYGQWILLGLVAESFLCNFLSRTTGLSLISSFDILGWVMRFATDIFGWPIKALWGLIPW